ncbi:50S ribosomal protein L3 [Candidatus Woesearchaeota archaeon]|nr:50S ribosomal protein L3 [Candidatus Woesearchaeota archaeon]
MPKVSHPRRGSMQFWPRKRSKHSLARISSWSAENKAKPLGFIGYKAGMTHVIAVDNRPKSLTKGEKIARPATIIDCPPMTVAGVAFYTTSLLGMRKTTSVLYEKMDKSIGKKIQLPKKTTKKLAEVTGFDDLRLLVHTNPKRTPTGAKKPKLLEIALGGSKEDKLAYAKEMLGKEISLGAVFENGVQVDVHGITKGKGFQGTVKRYGVPIRQHKAEKTKRGIATLGSWTPKRIEFTVAQPGKMGYHLRTEYNKQIFKLGENGQEVTPDGGLTRYGTIKNQYCLLAGSVVGPVKRPVVLTAAIRPNKKIMKEAFTINTITK